MKEKEFDWDEEVKQVHHPEFDHILREVDRLFDIRKKALGEQKILKNLVLTRIYVPEKDYLLLETLPEFKNLHSLGGIPVSMIQDDDIKIDTEVEDPRKRKRKAVVYVRKSASV